MKQKSQNPSPLSELVLNKEDMLDSGGRYKTQSLFLEFEYSSDAIFTLKERDHVWNGKTYYSAKQLYLAEEDPTEYIYANKYFASWKHWLKITENKVFRKHIDEWREELEFKLRAKGVLNMMKSASEGNYQASKWLTDRGWLTRGAGRPSKADVDSEKAFQARVSDEYSADVHRLFANQGK